MYKIITDIKILDNLNQIIQQRENNPDVKYCEPLKHPLRDEWVITIDETLLTIYDPKELKELLKNNIETIPQEWDWPFPLRPIRVFIPFKLQAKAQISKAKKDKEEKPLKSKSKSDIENLGELLNTMLPLIPDFMVVNGGEDITIYLEELYLEHKFVLEQFPEIKIESK